jgi:hypothetical protein
MTYEQAFNKKKSLKFESFNEDGLTFYVFVTPGSHDDFKRYLEGIPGYLGHLSDEDAKRYSTDGVFSVRGLWTNGADIAYKQL